MAVNKVIYGDQTLIDLTTDTATENDVARGKTFHDASGQAKVGSASTGGSDVTWNQIQQSGTKIAEITIDGNQQDVYVPSSGGGSSTLAGLSDVDLSSIQNGQVLTYDSVTQKTIKEWETWLEEKMKKKE